MPVTNGVGPSKTFRVASLIKIGGTKVTDQGRGDVSVDIQRIEETRRMANGTMRKFYVTEKHTFTVSWSDIPKDTAKTVDGGWGGQAIEDYYLSTPGAVSITITWGDNTTKTYSVFISDFSKDYVSRYKSGDLWNVSLTMEEI